MPLMGLVLYHCKIKVLSQECIKISLPILIVTGYYKNLVSAWCSKEIDVKGKIIIGLRQEKNCIVTDVFFVKSCLSFVFVEDYTRRETMGYKFIELEVEDTIGILTLARTERLNALSLEFAAEITGAVKELWDTDEVRAIILASNAQIFCAGLDLKSFISAGLDGSAKGSLNFPTKLHELFDCCDVLEECPKPLIAAVHGQCMGGGLDMIAACDIRLCTEDATFSLKETGIGLVADMGVLQRLPLIIGQGFTREMAYTARFFSAKEVARMGLINNTYTDRAVLMDEAKKLAKQIAENAPLAVQETKKVLNYSRNATIKDGMSMAMQKNMVLFISQDLREAMEAFKEKRKPDFKGK
jgi:enoyl-CoA hydratase